MTRRSPGRRPAFTLIELLVVMAIISVLIGLLLPAVQACRAAARRAQCQHSEMQAAIAMQNYESAFESFPPGVVDNAGPITNRPAGYGHSWLVQILPFLDEKNLYNSVNFTLSAYDPANTTARGIRVATLLCPADPDIAGQHTGGFAPTSYAGSHHDVEAPIDEKNNGMLFLNSRVAIDDIPDGASHTVLFGEAKFEPEMLGWASGSRASLRNGGTLLNAPRPLPTKGNPLPVGGFSSYHPGTVNFAMADGSVRYLRPTMNATILQNLTNRKDGGLLSAGSY